MSERWDALVIEPGHGSEWITDVHFDGDEVVGTRSVPIEPFPFYSEDWPVRYPASYVLKLSGRITR